MFLITAVAGAAPVPVMLADAARNEADIATTMGGD
jgi:hypothetical protein